MKESRLIGVSVFAIGAITLFVLIPIGIVSPSDVPTLALAPEFWPIVIASTFTLMGILLAVLPGHVDQESRAEIQMLPTRSPRLLAILAALFVFYFLVPYIGMVVPAMFIIFGLSWFAGERRWMMLIVISVMIPIILTLFFLFVANIPIPLGMFEFVYG